MYDKNIESLKKNYPDVYDKIISGNVEYDNSNIAIETAKNGEPIIKYSIQDRDIYLNSRYNPSREASKYIEEYVDMPEESILIVYGLSNGSYIRAYLENISKNTICIR